jgi:hypothetical protein
MTQALLRLTTALRSHGFGLESCGRTELQKVALYAPKTHFVQAKRFSRHPARPPRSVSSWTSCLLGPRTPLQPWRCSPAAQHKVGGTFRSLASYGLLLP